MSQDPLSPTVRAALSRVREAVDAVLDSLEVINTSLEAINETLTSTVQDFVTLRDTGVSVSFLSCDDDD